MSTEQQLIELESRIAHQEDSIQTLSHEIFEQQKQITALQTQCAYLLEQLKNQPGQSPADQLQDDVPPHY